MLDIDKWYYNLCWMGNNHLYQNDMFLCVLYNVGLLKFNTAKYENVNEAS